MLVPPALVTQSESVTHGHWTRQKEHAINSAMHLLDILALLGAALLFAKILGGLLEKIGIPSVLAELLTGVLVGNLGGSLGHAFANIQSSEILRGLSELGVLFLLFLVGLETNVKELTKVGKDASLAAVVGVIAPFALAFGLVPFLGPSSLNRTLFLGAALSATSVGITARVLSDAGELRSKSGQIILGAAVIDDVLGIIVLAIVAALVTQGSVSGGMVGGLLGKIALFGVGVYALRRWILPRMIRVFRPLEVSGTITILMLSLCLIFSWVAEQMGLAGIIGAFALGLALDDVQFKGFRLKGSTGLEHLMKPVTDFLVPVFFIVIGMRVKLAAFGDSQVLVFALALTLCAIVGKLACGWVLSRDSRRAGADRWLVGFGMIPRGEVGLIFAGMGIQTGVFSQVDYNAVVAMVAVTTLLAPGLIAYRLRRRV